MTLVAPPSLSNSAPRYTNSSTPSACSSLTSILWSFRHSLAWLLTFLQWSLDRLLQRRQPVWWSCLLYRRIWTTTRWCRLQSLGLPRPRWTSIVCHFSYPLLSRSWPSRLRVEIENITLPCFTSDWTWNHSVVPPSSMTAHSKLLYIAFTNVTTSSGIPYIDVMFHKLSLCTESNAFSKSMKCIPFVDLFKYFPKLRVKIWSMVLLFPRKGACPSSGSFSALHNRTNNHMPKILLMTGKSVILKWNRRIYVERKKLRKDFLSSRWNSSPPPSVH